MNGLGWLIRDYCEMLRGKIDWTSCVYLFLPAPPRKTRLRFRDGREFPSEIDGDGREYAAFKGRGAHCKNMELWQAEYPRRDNQGNPYFVVPAAECKACQFHEPAKRRQRFACCLYDRERQKTKPTIQQIAAESLQKAQELLS